MSPVSRSSFESNLVNGLGGSAGPSTAGRLARVAAGFGLGCAFERLVTTFAPGLTLRSLLASATGVRVPDHKPPGDTAALAVESDVYLELDPELAVRRTLPSELFQLLRGSIIEKGDSVGLLAAGDPVNLRRASSDGL